MTNFVPSVISVISSVVIILGAYTVGAYNILKF